MYYSTQKKLLIVGGAAFSEELFKEVYDNEIPIVAADGGANFLTEKNISPKLVIGDLDSVSQQKIHNIEPEKIIRISEQDSTDLEKVLFNTQSPLTIGIGFLGAQIDHELAALSALVKFSHKKIIFILIFVLSGFSRSVRNRHFKIIIFRQFFDEGCFTCS